MLCLQLSRHLLSPVEVVKQPFCAHNELPHDVRRNRQLGIALRWPDENKPSSDFNGWRFLREITSIFHPAPLQAATEQQGIRYGSGADSKPPARLTKIIFDERLPANDPRDFANDNTPLGDAA